MLKPCLVLFLFCHTSSHASLMFSSQEVAVIIAKRAQDHTHKNRNNEDCLECNGVLFQSDTSWSVWINGEKLTDKCHQCRDGKIKITKVSQGHITLEWKHKGTRHLVTLKPNQHYDATLKKVISAQ